MLSIKPLHSQHSTMSKSGAPINWKSYLPQGGGARTMFPPGLQISLLTLTFDLLSPAPFDAHALQTTCANLHKNGFIHFQTIMFTSLVTDKQTDGQVKNIMPPASSDWWRNKQCTMGDFKFH